jgi:hypothetical protein
MTKRNNSDRLTISQLLGDLIGALALFVTPYALLVLGHGLGY